MFSSEALGAAELAVSRAACVRANGGIRGFHSHGGSPIMDGL